MNQQIIESKIIEYWADESILIDRQTILNKFNKNGYDIEIKEEVGKFLDGCGDITRYRTYVYIYKDGVKLKRRLFYGDNGLKWEQYVNEYVR